MKKLIPLVLVVLLGCSQVGAQDSSGSSSPKRSPAPVAVHPDEDQLRGAILSLEDLPAGWISVGRLDLPEASEVTEFGCSSGMFGSPTPAEAEVQWEFQNGGSAQLLHYLASYASVEEAQTELALISAQMDDCGQVVQSDEVSDEYIELTAIEVPDFGDETVAYRFTSEVIIRDRPQEAFGGVGDFIFVRLANIIMSVSYIGIDERGEPPVSRKDAEHMLQRSVDLLESVTAAAR